VAQVEPDGDRLLGKGRISTKLEGSVVGKVEENAGGKNQRTLSCRVVQQTSQREGSKLGFEHKLFSQEEGPGVSGKKDRGGWT